ncbi:unnamed protein product [Rhizoctonia solani]|uniref:Uncharacterized protein n=1 Tax=Rhizoctonia solani TaxID=456999 RepID=A0A8H3DBY1_9AGAM|nr:unnamed protein product [Rhizoctonia solani]
MNATCPADPALDYCSFVLANPDVSGIGVGLNVLAATFESNLQLTRDTARSSYVLSSALVLASVAQWRIGGMGLFDAIVGVQLATLMTVFMLFNIRYISSLGTSINISSTLFLILYTYWGIQTWTFPACPSHSLTQFVIFGHSVPATNLGLRTFALVVFGCMGIVSLGAALLLVWWCGKVWIHGGGANARKVEVWMNVRRERWGINSGAGKSRITFFFPLPIMAYLIISTEQTVARNQRAHSLSNLDQWTFGQTLAVVMLLAQFVEAGLWVWKERKRARELKWRGKSGVRGVQFPVLI